MFMGEHDAGDLVEIESGGGGPSLDLAGAEAGVD
jgi:hypothetical protein